MFSCAVPGLDSLHVGSHTYFVKYGKRKMKTKQNPASKIPVQAKNTSMCAHNISTTKMT